MNRRRVRVADGQARWKRLQALDLIKPVRRGKNQGMYGDEHITGSARVQHGLSGYGFLMSSRRRWYKERNTGLKSCSKRSRCLRNFVEPDIKGYRQVGFLTARVLKREGAVGTIASARCQIPVRTTDVCIMMKTDDDETAGDISPVGRFGDEPDSWEPGRDLRLPDSG